MVTSILLFGFGVYLLLFTSIFQLKLLGVGVTILGIVIAGLSISTKLYEERIARTPSYGLPSKVEVTTESGDKSKPTRKKFGNIEYINDSSVVIEKPKEHLIKKKFLLFDLFLKSFLKSNKKETIPKKKVPKNETQATIQTETFDENPANEGFKVRGPLKAKSTRDVQLSIVESPLDKGDEKQTQSSIESETKTQNFHISVSESQISTVTKEEVKKENKWEVKRQELSPEKSQDKANYQRHTFQPDLGEIISSESFEEIKTLDLMRRKLTDVLKIIPAVTNTQTAVFFLFNSSKNLLLLQSVITEHQELIDRERKYFLNGDLLSQILRSAQPEIITNLNPHSIKDLIPYYLTNVEVGSFIGIPVFNNRKIVGLLCADSKIENAYNEYTVNFLLYLSKIIVFYLENFFQKTEVQLEANILNYFGELRNLMFSKEIGIDGLIKNLISFILSNFPFITVGIVAKDIESGDFAIAYVKSKYEYDTHLIKKRVKIEETFLGLVINGKETIIRQISSKKIRVHPDETRLKDGYFLGVPIRSYIGVIGALFGYTEKNIQIDKETTKRIDEIAFVFGLVLQISILVNMMEKMKSQYHSPIIFNREKFIKSIMEEVERCNNIGGTFSLCTFSLDNYSLNLESSSEKHLRKIAKEQLLNLILEQIKLYDKIGILDENTNGLLLIGKNKTDAFYFMEEIRQKFAVTVIQSSNQKYYFTLSGGIEQFEPKFSVNSLLNRCAEALKIAQKSKNKVVIY